MRHQMVCVHDVAQRAKDVAADYLLAKPFLPFQLKQMIEKSVPSAKNGT